MRPARPDRARRALALASLVLALSACSTPSAQPLPAGPGLVTSDRTPPAGALAYEAPEWQAGDRFVYQKAGLVRLPLRVVAGADGDLALQDEQDGRILCVGPAALERGQTTPEGERDYELDPGDHLLSWPLWEGKRWTSQFVSRASGRPDLPLIAHYHCDASETVAVPAGSFACLRVWRRVRVAAQGDYPERVSLLWYAPEVGAVVRRLDDGLLSELVEFQRQR